MLKISYYKFNVIKNIFIFQLTRLCDIFFKRFIINEHHEKKNIFKSRDITSLFYINLSKSFEKSY